MATETLYKIRDPSTGLFSTGGMDPRWHKKGKVWRGMGPLKNHINVVSRARKTYAGCEVVEVIIRTDEGTTFPVRDLIEAKERKDEEERRRRDEERRRHEEEAERSRARALIAKYGTNP